MVGDTVRAMLPRSAATCAVPVLATLVACMLARPTPAQVGGLLAGSPRIGTIRALIPKQGRDAGRLIVWVRVDHASGTPRAVARERPETVHVRANRRACRRSFPGRIASAGPRRSAASGRVLLPLLVDGYQCRRGRP
jgi:hypothetical protein